MSSEAKPRTCEVLGEHSGDATGMIKPLRDWTLGEVRVECMTCKCGEGCRLWDGEEKVCRLEYCANGWDLTDPTRFTADEVADAEVLQRALLADGFERDERGDIFTTSKFANRTLLDSRMFPSILPGQHVELAEII